jgi:hypothetical protein
MVQLKGGLKRLSPHRTGAVCEFNSGFSHGNTMGMFSKSPAILWIHGCCQDLLLHAFAYIVTDDKNILGLISLMFLGLSNNSSNTMVQRVDQPKGLKEYHKMEKEVLINYVPCTTETIINSHVCVHIQAPS